MRVFKTKQNYTSAVYISRRCKIIENHSRITIQKKKTFGGAMLVLELCLYYVFGFHFLSFRGVWTVHTLASVYVSLYFCRRFILRLVTRCALLWSPLPRIERNEHFRNIQSWFKFTTKPKVYRQVCSSPVNFITWLGTYNIKCTNFS